jgi:predicted deacylase
MPSALPQFPVFIETPELSPFISGNTGIAGFTSLNSSRPGPHAVLVSLMHGNEIAGATVLAELLLSGFTPLRGKLTCGFANLDAFAKFDPTNPLASRYVEEDLNRVWDDVQLFGVRQSLELERARAIRPLIDTADVLLDLHSMLWPSDPVLLCGPAPRGRELAARLATPGMIIADSGHSGGKRLIDYAHFTAVTGHAAGNLVEAGQHWEPATITQTRESVFALLRHAGMMEGGAHQQSPDFAEVTQTVTARTNRFVFLREYRGGEVIREAGTLIAHDGDTEIRTPFENCLLVMPSLRVSLGHTAVRLARFANGASAR